MVLVLASNYERYLLWCEKNNYRPMNGGYRFVRAPTDLYGYSRGTILIIESYPSWWSTDFHKQWSWRFYVFDERDWRMRRGAYVKVTEKLLYIYTPYIEELVDDIRDFPKREWNQDDRCWQVPIGFRDLVEEVLKRYFGENVRWSEPHITTDVRDWIDQLFDAVPKQHQQRVYRALASAFHPDIGGDAKVMQRINDAYGRRNGGRSK